MGAGLIIIESIQTLIDLPLLLLVIPIAILTPYRIGYVKRDLMTLTPNEWRVQLLKYTLAIVTDIPYILMFANLLLSVYMALRLKSHLKQRLYNEDGV